MKTYNEIGNPTHVDLNHDLSWVDARKASKLLLKKAGPLHADLSSNQTVGLENILTDILFHVPKWGHELLGMDGKALNLKERSWFHTPYGSQIAIAGPSGRQGDLLRCLQIAKVDFNAWSYEFKDDIIPAERKFPHYLT